MRSGSDFKFTTIKTSHIPGNRTPNRSMGSGKAKARVASMAKPMKAPETMKIETASRSVELIRKR